MIGPAHCVVLGEGAGLAILGSDVLSQSSQPRGAGALPLDTK